MDPILLILAVYKTKLFVKCITLSTTFTKPQESNALFAVKLGAKPEPPLPYDLVRLAQKNGCYLM